MTDDTEPTTISIRSDGTELAYEALGDPDDPPMVLIQGTGDAVGWMES